MKALSSFYLIDEVGYLDVFNLYHERVVETIELYPIRSKQVSAILKFHSQRAFSNLMKFNQSNYYLTIVGNENNKFCINSGTRMKSVGVLGDVVLWHLVSDVNCAEFVGHEGMVSGIVVPQNNNNSNNYQGNNNNNNNSSGIPKRNIQITREERIIFSAGQDDGSIRCWDEYDLTENYQLRNKSSKGLTEITVMYAIWYLNRIVTGHENGTICVWNADTGNTVISRVLRQTISSLIEATDLKRNKLLVASDYSGKIAIWNLTLHSLNPSVLVQEGSVITGFHLRDDPGILSLTFHDRTRTMFSGGNDSTICYWRVVQGDLSSASVTGRLVSWLVTL